MDAEIIKSHLHWDPQNQSIYSDVPIGFTGQLELWPMPTAPAGWLVCDGSLYKKADYPRLWALLGDTWGTSTTTQFYVPNLKGKVPVGRDQGQTEFASIAQTGGDKNLQAHTHPLYQWLMNGGAASGVHYGFGFQSNTGAKNRMDTGSSEINNNYVDTAGTGNSGNLQPYAVVNYIIKA